MSYDLESVANVAFEVANHPVGNIVIALFLFAYGFDHAVSVIKGVREHGPIPEYDGIGFTSKMRVRVRRVVWLFVILTLIKLILEALILAGLHWVHFLTLPLFVISMSGVLYYYLWVQFEFRRRWKKGFAQKTDYSRKKEWVRETLGKRNISMHHMAVVSPMIVLVGVLPYVELFFDLNV